jgi:hypothetical protein
MGSVMTLSKFFNGLALTTKPAAPLRGNRWLLLGLLAALVSCGGQAASGRGGASGTGGMVIFPKITAIQEVQKTVDPNSGVTIKGVVGDRVPILDGTVYQLQDSTGKIWVLTQKQPPNPGKEVVVTGILRFKSIPLNGQEQGSVYVEQQSASP